MIWGYPYFRKPRYKFMWSCIHINIQNCSELLFLSMSTFVLSWCPSSRLFMCVFLSFRLISAFNCIVADRWCLNRMLFYPHAYLQHLTNQFNTLQRPGERTPVVSGFSCFYRIDDTSLSWRSSMCC